MKTILFPCILILYAGQVLAQDPVFSQFYANKPLLNPALTALDEGTAITLNYRNLWRRVPGGFQTYSAAAETQWASCAKGKRRQPFFNFGYGLTALHDREGEGLLCTNEAQVTASAFHLFGRNAAWHVGAGVGGGQKSVDFSKLTFSDQLDAIEGKILTVSGIPVRLETRSYADLSAGAALRFGHRFGDTEAFQSLGMSIRHLLYPIESVDQGGNAHLPAVYTLHYGSALPVWVDHEGSKKYYVYWSPQLQAVWQGRYGVLGYGFYGLYRGAMGGVFFRHPFGARPNGAAFGSTQTLMFTAGFETPFLGNNLLRVDYSYDLNIGGFAAYGGGAHEISLKINLFQWSPGGCKSSGSNDGKSGKNTRCPSWPGSRSRRF